MNELQKWKLVNRATSIEALINILEDLGDVEISDGRGAYNMAERARLVETGSPRNLLTRNYGIRAQYVFLKALENHE